MGRFARLLLDPGWRNSRWRRESATLVVLLGSFFGHSPPAIDPLPPEIATPLERDRDRDQLPPPGPPRAPR